MARKQAVDSAAGKSLYAAAVFSYVRAWRIQELYQAAPEHCVPAEQQHSGTGGDLIADRTSRMSRRVDRLHRKIADFQLIAMTQRNVSPAVSQLVIGRISSSKASLNQSKILIGTTLQHLDLPRRRCHAKVAVLSERVYAARVIAVAMRQQQQADARKISRRRAQIPQQTFRFNPGPRVDQRIFITIVEQVDVAIEVMAQAQLAASDELHVLMQLNELRHAGSLRRIVPLDITNTGRRRRITSSAGLPRTAIRSHSNPGLILPTPHKPRASADKAVADAIAWRALPEASCISSISPSRASNGTPVAPASVPATTRTPASISCCVARRLPSRKSPEPMSICFARPSVRPF